MRTHKVAARFHNLALAFALAVATLPAHAAVPQTLNYQGQLTTAAGMPVNSTVSMVFSLYNVASGGAALWTETQNVAVANGLYNVTLGSVAPIALPFDVPYFIGIKVGADAEMTPRMALTSSATALRAQAADSIPGSGTVGGNLTVSGSIAAASLSGSGAGLTSLNASALTGTVADAALSTNIPRLNATTQTYSGGAKFAGSVGVGNDATVCAAGNAGTVRWNGSAFQGCDGATWRDLSARKNHVSSGTVPYVITTTVGGNLVGKSLTFSASAPTVRVTYFDGFGTPANGPQQCSWNVLLDGVQTPIGTYTNTQSYFIMSYATEGYLSISPGAHTLEIKLTVMGVGGGGCSNYGYWSLAVEEIP